MSTLQVSGKPIEFNRKGFLSDHRVWNEEVAEAIASAEKLELTDCHWAAIRFIRNYYEENQFPPSSKVLIREVGDKLDAFKCTYRTLKALFPLGGCKQACRIAGLPDYYCVAC